MKVLLVDDSDDVRLMLRLSIERTRGWKVVGEAKNGLDAVEAAFELKPDVVILDVEMPLMGGLQAAPLIKRAAPDVRILIYSASEEVGLRRPAALGTRGLVSKGMSLLQLKAEVERLLRIA